MYASYKDVPSQLFDYFVMPAHLPYAAFPVSHFWGFPAKMWGALTNYDIVNATVETERAAFSALELGLFNSIEKYQLASKVIPGVSKKGVSRLQQARATPTVAINATKIKKAWKAVQDLWLDDQDESLYDAVTSGVALTGKLKALLSDVRGIVGDAKASSVGWGVGIQDDPAEAAADRVQNHGFDGRFISGHVHFSALAMSTDDKVLRRRERKPDSNQRARERDRKATQGNDEHGAKPAAAAQKATVEEAAGFVSALAWLKLHGGGAAPAGSACENGGGGEEEPDLGGENDGGGVRNQATVGVYMRGGVSTVCSAVYIRREKKR